MKKNDLSAQPAATAIEVEHLRAGYDGDVVLKDVTFTVARSEIFFIIGGSGCGKSTLLRHMVGLNAPMSGTVTFLGQPFTHADLTSRRAMLKHSSSLSIAHGPESRNRRRRSFRARHN